MPMRPAHSSFRRIGRFLRDDSGLAMIEFAICLPLLILVFGMVIEGSRLMWSFQTTISGVRDASRYLARVTPSDVCQPGEVFDGRSAELQVIIEERLGTGTSILPKAVAIIGVFPVLDCVVGTYRISPAPVAEVTARVQITHPFASLFQLIGGTLDQTVTVDVSDQSRVYGL